MDCGQSRAKLDIPIDVQLALGIACTNADIALDDGQALSAGLPETDGVVRIIAHAHHQPGRLSRSRKVTDESFIAGAASGVGRELNAGLAAITHRRHNRPVLHLQPRLRVGRANADVAIVEYHHPVSIIDTESDVPPAGPFIDQSVNPVLALQQGIAQWPDLGAVTESGPRRAMSDISQKDVVDNRIPGDL